VLHAFSNGPAIGSRFEVPLSWREILGGVEDHLFAGFEQLKGLFFVGLSEFLSADGGGEKQRQSASEGLHLFSRYDADSEAPAEARR
jgi:hypothetical protein